MKTQAGGACVWSSFARGVSAIRAEKKRLELAPVEHMSSQGDGRREKGDGGDRRVSSARTQALYATHQKTQEKIEALRGFYATLGCTFAPDITSRARRSASTEARYERLYRTASLTKEKKMALAEQFEEKCSFKPKINARSMKAGPQGERYIYLHKTAIDAERKIQVKRELLIKETCTFTPKINRDRRRKSKSRSRERRGKGIERMSPSKEELQRKKVQRLQCKVALDLKECTFKPKRLSKPYKTRVSVGVIGLFGDMYERSQATLLVWHQRRTELRYRLEAEAFKECTFHPKTNHEPTRYTSIQVLHTCKKLFTGWKERQLLYKRLRQRLTFEETNGFMPVLNVNHGYHRAKDPQRFEKLYECGKLKVEQSLRHEKDPDRVHSLVQREEEEALSHCTFAPELNPASIQMDSLSEASRLTKAKRFKRLYHYADVLRAKLASSMRQAEDTARAESNTRFSSEKGSFEATVGHSKSVDLGHILKLHDDHEANLARLEQKKKVQTSNILQASSTIFSASSVASMDLQNVDFSDTESLCASTITSRTSAADMRHISRLYNNAFEIESKRQAKKKDMEEQRNQKLSTKFSAETIAQHDRQREQQKQLRPKFDRTRMVEYSRKQHKHNMKNATASSKPFDTIWEDSSVCDEKGLLDIEEEKAPTHDSGKPAPLAIEDNVEMKID